MILTVYRIVAWVGIVYVTQRCSRWVIDNPDERTEIIGGRTHYAGQFIFAIIGWQLVIVGAAAEMFG